MDRLNSMGIFVQVASKGSFTAAAEKLGLSRAQISKSVMQLEAHLGTRLLNRTTRKISLTETGQISLTISAPISFGVLHLQKAIPEYIKLYPRVKIALSLADRFIDVVSEGFDVGIRIAELEDSSLIARKIAPCKRVFCASPDYLRQNGIPNVPIDLAIHSCLTYSNDLKPDAWVLHGSEGKQSIKVNGPLCADNGDILKEAAISGLGIVSLPTFIVGADLKTGKLQQVLTEYCPSEISIYAVFPSRRYLSAKVRTFVDFLSEYFGDEPGWD